MSSENRFEKTFSRKKKENKKSTGEKGKDKQQRGDDDNSDEHRVLLLGLAAQPLNPPTPKKTKTPTPNKTEGKPVSNSKNKKVVAESPISKKKIVIGYLEQNVKDQQRHEEEEEKKKKRRKKEEEEEEPIKNDGKKGKSEARKPKRKGGSEGGETAGSKKLKQEKKKKDKGAEVEVDKEREESSECTFAINRIVKIIKSEAPDYRISQESVLLINKAAEKFIELFAEDSYDCAVRDKKSFIGYKHLSAAVGNKKKFDFLSDFVPEKVPAEKALVLRKSVETS